MQNLINVLQQDKDLCEEIVPFGQTGCHSYCLPLANTVLSSTARLLIFRFCKTKPKYKLIYIVSAYTFP